MKNDIYDIRCCIVKLINRILTQKLSLARQKNNTFSYSVKYITTISLKKMFCISEI